MPIYQGNTKIGEIYQGGTKIGYVYQGEDLIFIDASVCPIDIGTINDKSINETAQFSFILPEADEAIGDTVYSVPDLPEGWMFDADTRTVSGTAPTVESGTSTTITLTLVAVDAAECRKEKTFDVIINITYDCNLLPPDPFVVSGTGGGVGISPHRFTKFFVIEPDTEVNLVLPEWESQVDDSDTLTYSIDSSYIDGGNKRVDGLPTGLSFDPDTRTLSGMVTSASITRRVFRNWSFQYVATSTLLPTCRRFIQCFGYFGSLACELTLDIDDVRVVSSSSDIASTRLRFAAGNAAAPNFVNYIIEGFSDYWEVVRIGRGDYIIRGKEMADTPVSEYGTFPITVTAIDTLKTDCETTTTFDFIFQPEGCNIISKPNVSNQTVASGDRLDVRMPTVSGANTYSLVGRDGDTLPPGLTFNSSTRWLSGRTTAAAGEYRLRYTASNSSIAGCQSSVDFTVTVTSSGTCTLQKPSVADVSVSVGTSADITMPAPSGTKTVVRTWISGRLPPGLSYDPDTRKITGTPTTAGRYSVTYFVSDTGIDRCVQFARFRITVVSACSIGLPTIDNEFVTRNVNQTLVLPEGTGVNGTATYSATGLPPGMKFTASDRTIFGTPTKNGTYTITYTVTDSTPANCTATRTFTITVQDSCALSDLSINDFSLSEDVRMTSSVLPTLTGAVGTLTHTFVSEGSDTLTLPNGLSYNAQTRTLSGTPTQTGTFNYTYTVTDTGLIGCSRTVNFSIVVNAQVCNTSFPFIRLFNGDQNAFFSHTLPTMRNAVGATAYSIEAIGSGNALPNGLTFSASTRRIEGTPTEFGTFSFYYIGEDSRGCRAVNTVVIEIARGCEISASPTIDDNTVAAGEQIIFTIEIGNTVGNVSVTVSDEDNVLGGAIASYFKGVAIISSGLNGVPSDIAEGEYIVNVMIQDTVCVKILPVTITVETDDAIVVFGDLRIA